MTLHSLSYLYPPTFLILLTLQKKKIIGSFWMLLDRQMAVHVPHSPAPLLSSSPAVNIKSRSFQLNAKSVYYLALSILALILSHRQYSLIISYYSHTHFTRLNVHTIAFSILTTNRFILSHFLFILYFRFLLPFSLYYRTVSVDYHDYIPVLIPVRFNHFYLFLLSFISSVLFS